MTFVLRETVRREKRFGPGDFRTVSETRDTWPQLNQVYRGLIHVGSARDSDSRCVPKPQYTKQSFTLTYVRFFSAVRLNCTLLP